ncbi:MAG: AAA family ATPase [Gemmataceae bacterium]|nr:AAA family ATPase [Gemmataceae bacterium]MCI0739606.1 AAA family ATPase [Gemmataceae bacterium]
MIERLRLRNFRRYNDATLRFQPGLNFIQGLNNVGKTSLFYAIEYALFGRVENFKTIRSLMQPGKRSLGVELVFVGRQGERYLLQRVHMLPAKGRKTLDGHYTLKALLDEGEQYVLASDFGDTEDKLALRLHELTGLTRRFFSIALHMRQGDIPSILEGARQLDIVLGVTAASMAEDELRQMALELEKECAGLAVLKERLRAFGNELTQIGGQVQALATERQATADKLAALSATADSRQELERTLKPLVDALAAYQKRSDESALHRRRLADEQKRKEDANRAGSKEELEKERVKLESEAAARTKSAKKLRGELEEVDAEQRRLDQQRGDLAGRIERRRSLPTGKGAKCEMCGQPIKAAQTAKELEQWTDEQKQLDKALAEFHTKQAKLRAALDKDNLEERKQLERGAHLAKQLEVLTALETSVALMQKASEEAAAAEKEALAAVKAEAKSTEAKLQKASLEARWNLEDEPAALIASIGEAIHTLRQTLAERVGRQIAERQSLTDLLARFEKEAQALGRRQAELEREQATAQRETHAQEARAARAARFRRLSAGFKDLQVQIRSDAATKLAPDTIALHRQLSERDEFESLSIDPASYAVQVVPRDLGQEVPAGLYEGGGHRLLLGLAFRLAVARLVAHCPFLMLDEPTYGLDAAHRAALMTRIAAQDVSRQILLVTHHAKEDVTGHRIEVRRQDKETVIAEA